MIFLSCLELTLIFILIIHLIKLYHLKLQKSHIKSGVLKDLSESDWTMKKPLDKWLNERLGRELGNRGRG